MQDPNLDPVLHVNLPSRFFGRQAFRNPLALY